MFSRFGLLADWIVDHRWWTLGLVVLWTTLTGLGFYDPYILLPDPPPPDLTFTSDESSRRTRLPQVSPMRVASGDVIVVARSEDFFTPGGVKAIRAAVEALQALDQVDDVIWMDRAPPLNIFGLSEPILPQRNVTESRLEAAKSRAQRHPMVAGQLMSADTNTLLLMVSIDWLFVNEDSDCTDVLRDTAAAAAKDAADDVDMTFQVTGNVPIRVSRAAETRANELKYQAIGYTVVLVIAFILFRGLAAVLIVALAPAFGVFWTLGLFHYIGLEDNPFNSVIVPVLLCMIGFTDGVHMMVQIRRHRAAGSTSREAARQAIREVGLACWLTSLTTAIGFGSLMLASHEVVREFGFCCVIGVLMTFVSVITIIPLACASPLGRNVHAGYGHNLIDRNLGRVSVVIDYVLGRYKRVCVLAIASTAIFALATLQLQPDERRTSSLASGSEPAQALAHIDEAFGGMETANVSIQWNSSVPDGDGEIAKVTGKVDEILNAEPLIGHPLSLVRLLDALPGVGEASTRMSMLELLPPPLKRAYYTPELRQAYVRFRLQDIGIASYGPVFERLEEELAQIQSEHPNFYLDLTGRAVYRWQNLFQIVNDLAYSLGTASIIIFAVLTLVYRSLRLGLISVVPNLFPLAATGSVLWLLGYNLEIVSVCAFTVCLGIAVDDTIHFLTRYQDELSASGDRTMAIKKAFTGVGTALIMTTIVLVIGFAAVRFTDDTRDLQIFTMMGILTLSTALFADLVFLPALLARFGLAPADRRAEAGQLSGLAKTP